MEITPEIQERLDKLYAKIDEYVPPRMSVRLKPSRAKTTVFDSKMGGVPYLPKNMEYPKAREGEFEGRPLFFLAQLNFGKLPKLEGFPTEGILQFFAGCVDDDIYGMEDWGSTDQNRFRIIYHENVITDAAQLYSEDDMPDFGDGEEFMPFTGEFLLNAEAAAPARLTPCDYRFDNAAFKAFKEVFDVNVDGMYGDNGIYRVDEELGKALWETSAIGTRMGGYPFFTQSDVRKEGSPFDILLFQSDSENGGTDDSWDDEICWGDAGVANFFISSEDLKKKDFSNVLYNWDCG